MLAQLLYNSALYRTFKNIFKTWRTKYFFLPKCIIENFENSGLNRAIQALENHVSSTSRRYSYLYPLSILPILDYLLRKEKEVRNLRTIVRGKDLKLSNERIKEIMVV